MSYLYAMTIEKEFLAASFPAQQGKVSWSSPSNIALVKYWGKYGNQLPQNPSLSFTLTNCTTTTQVQFQPKPKNEQYAFSFLFEGKKQPAFHPKMEAFFERIAPFCPYLYTHELTIASFNSFPHSSGIASSAASMSALALSLLSIEAQGGGLLSKEAFNKKASFLARLGSGSAARSIEGPMMSWGETNAIKGSSQKYATCIDQEIHPVFRSYQDTILIIDKGQKKVSSTLGHQLMDNHPYATARFEQAHQHMTRLMAILAQGELDDFMQLVELEALTLHALMMASNPYFVLMQPNTLAVLNKIWAFRAATKLPLCFTLDAGANVHLLYPEQHKEAIGAFIATELASFCEAGQYIEDQVGTGAKKL